MRRISGTTFDRIGLRMIGTMAERVSFYEFGFTGIEGRDQDHDKLIAALNHICDEVKKGSQHYDDIAALVDDLAHSVRQHFTVEENEMLHRCYMNYDIHKKSHGEIIAALHEVAVSLRFCAIHRTHKPLTNLIMPLFAHHGHIYDRPFCRFLTERAAAPKNVNG